jgi:hypothetical protein
MPATEQATEKIVRNLREATERLQEDLARVELWTGALNGFTQPVPNYEPGDSRFVLRPGKATGARQQSANQESDQHRATAPRG